MSRDENAPEDISENVTAHVDSRASRRRTVRGVDVSLLKQETEIASESRKTRTQQRGARAERWFVLGGAVAAYIVLGIELWRITSGNF